MKKCITLYLFLLIGYCTYAQSNDTLYISHKEIKDFFKLGQPFRGNLYISDKPEGNFSKEGFRLFFPKDSLLTEADLDFMEIQANQTANITWDSSLIEKSYLIKFSETKSLDHYISYSVPVFSMDHNICVLFVTNNCNLALCGDGMVYILRKRNNVWDVIDGFLLWIS